MLWRPVSARPVRPQSESSAISQRRPDQLSVYRKLRVQHVENHDLWGSGKSVDAQNLPAKQSWITCEWIAAGGWTFGRGLLLSHSKIAELAHLIRRGV